jgi:hypothetical protein
MLVSRGATITASQIWTVNSQSIFPSTVLERLSAGILQRAGDATRIYIRTSQWILRGPGLVEIFCLEETLEASIHPAWEEACLFGVEHVLPILTGIKVFLLVGRVVHSLKSVSKVRREAAVTHDRATHLGHQRDAKVIVGIFQTAGNGSRHGTETLVVQVLHCRNVSASYTYESRCQEAGSAGVFRQSPV